MATEQQLNLEFVREVEKYPCLYNFNLADYVRKDITDKAWAQIGEKFNLSGPQCKEKWKNVRCVFVRNLKPRKKKKPYYLNEAMQFTLPFIKPWNVSGSENVPKPTNTNEVPNIEASDEENSNMSLEEQALASHYVEASLSPLVSWATPFAETIPVSTPSPPSSEPIASSSKCLKFRKKKARKRDSFIDESILEYLRAKQPRMEPLVADLECQPKKMFLLSLLPDLESMSDQQMRTFKQRALQLIDEILEERPLLSQGDSHSKQKT